MTHSHRKAVLASFPPPVAPAKDLEKDDTRVHYELVRECESEEVFMTFSEDEADPEEMASFWFELVRDVHLQDCTRFPAVSMPSDCSGPCRDVTLRQIVQYDQNELTELVPLLWSDTISVGHQRFCAQGVYNAYVPSE